MKCNLLHINYKKCCFMYFSPNRNDKVPNDGTKYLNSKLKCEIGKLNRIKKCIPKIAYKELDHTLFESRLSYGISAWGGISFKKLEPLFITQKKCLRIMFGDNEAYHNKFKTAARVRPRKLQKLGAEFYELEHSKPLFNKK